MPKLSCIRGKDLTLFRFTTKKHVLDYVAFSWGSKFVQLGNKFIYIGKSPPLMFASERVTSVRKLGKILLGKTRKPFNFGALVRETGCNEDRGRKGLSREGNASIQNHRLGR